MFTMNPYHFKIAFPFALLLSIPSLSAQNVVLFDDFTDSAYTSSFLNGQDSDSNFFDISFGGGSVSPTGGNPGSTLEAFHFHDIDRDPSGQPFGGGDTEVQTFFSNSALSYNPATQGPIQSISFSLDIKTSAPFESLFFTIGDSNGDTVANGGGGFLSVVPNGEWQTVTLTEVTAAGASGRDFSGSDPLSFGFGFTSFEEVTNGPVLLEVLADNFRIEITPVPEPSSALLLTLGLLSLTRRRR